MADVDVNEAVKTTQATTLGLMGNSYLNLQDYQARVFLRLESQTDAIDAFVAKEVGKAGMATDAMGLNTAAQTPRNTLGGGS